MTTKSDTGINVLSTWQHRLVQAAAERFHCKVKIRTTPRVIGGKETTKSDRWVVLEGEPAAIDRTLSAVQGLLFKLNAGSDRFAASLPTDYSPTRRKIERRAWLEHQAQAEAEMLQGGG